MASSVTTRDDMSPSPRAEILIEAADVTPADTITVRRLAPDGEVPVRGGERRSPVGGFAVTDYELPAGVPVTYRVERFNASGASLGFALSLGAEVTIPDGWVVLQDPLAPERAVLVRAEVGFAATLKRGRPTSVFRAGLRTVALSGSRSMLMDIPIRLLTESDAQQAALDEILAESSVLVRTSPSMGLPGSLYVAVPDTPVALGNRRWGERDAVWDLTATEISRPSVEILVPVYTWQDLIDYYTATGGTWATLMADYATWLDVIRFPPPSV